jgi:uncharacterized protein (DUF849 family)
MEKKPLIINLACTGIIPTKSMNPHVPLSHGEIVEDVARCLELGVQIVHLHSRDSTGMHSNDPELYGRLIESIRKIPGGDETLLCVTTSGRKDSGLSARARVLELDGAMKPDMASLTLSSINFAQSASVSEPAVVRGLASKMLQKGIKPELEVFDLGMANFIGVLIKEGLVKAPYYVNLLLGNIYSAQADALSFSSLMAEMPGNSIVALAGLGRFQLKANVLGLLYTDGVRVGLEDNLWMDDGRTRPASNYDLIRRILFLAEELERPLMTRKKTREIILGLTQH